MQKMKSMKKSYEKYEIWVEPTRENDSVSRILLFSEKIPEGMLVNTDQGSQYGPTIGQDQWRDRRARAREGLRAAELRRAGLRLRGARALVERFDIEPFSDFSAK